MGVSLWDECTNNGEPIWYAQPAFQRTWVDCRILKRIRYKRGKSQLMKVFETYPATERNDAYDDDHHEDVPLFPTQFVLLEDCFATTPPKVKYLFADECCLNLGGRSCPRHLPDDNTMSLTTEILLRRCLQMYIVCAKRISTLPLAQAAGFPCFGYILYELPPFLWKKYACREVLPLTDVPPDNYYYGVQSGCPKKPMLDWEHASPANPLEYSTFMKKDSIGSYSTTHNNNSIWKEYELYEIPWYRRKLFGGSIITATTDS